MSSLRNTKGVNTTIAILAIVGVIAVASIGGYLLLKDDDYSPIGEYATYTISGSNGSATFSGTASIKIVDADSSRVKIQYTYDIYQTVSNVKSPLMVKTETKWETIEDHEDYGVKQRTDSIMTNWGTRGVDIYLEVDSGTSSTYYIGQNDGAIYRMVVTSNGITLTYNLSATNLL